MQRTVITLACALLLASAAMAQKVSSDWTTEAANPAPSRTLAQSAIEAFRKADFDRAHQLVLEGLSLEPQNARLHLLNAMCFHRLWFKGQSDAKDLARIGYEMALTHDGALWPAAWLLGVLAAGDGNHRLASEHYARALLLQRKVDELKLDYAQSNYVLGRPHVALAALESTTGDSPVILRAKAVAAAGSAQFDKSNRYLDQYGKTGGGGLELERLKDRVQELREGYQYAAMRTSDDNREVQVAQNDSTSDLMRALRAKRESEEKKLSGILAAQEKPDVGNTSTGSGRMVLLEAAILITEETYTSSRGVNLLNGLQLMLGSSDNPFLLRSRQNGTPSPGTSSLLYNRSISIPSVMYALNVANIGTQKAEVIARPTLVALDGKESKFSNGSRVSITIPGQYGGTLEDRDVGLQMSVTPTFISDSRLKLAINVSRSFFVPVVADAKFTGGFQTSQTQVTSNVEIDLEDTLILSGLTEKSYSNTRDATPGLGDIPVLQYAFSQAVQRKTATSVMIMLTPRNPVLTKEINERISTSGTMETELKGRYPEWFRVDSAPNWVEIMNHLSASSAFYHQFRKGDLFGEQWDLFNATNSRLQRALQFLYY